MNFYFHLFVILIALRDVWSSLLISQKLPPILMLFYFCLFTSVLTFIVAARDGVEKIFSGFGNNKSKYILLGILTSTAFGSMMFGISFIGAFLFTIIEHGLIPFFTFFLGIKLLKEKVDRNHLIGFIMALIGVQLIFIPGIQTSAEGKAQYIMGVVIATVGSLITAITSIQQKQLVDRQQKSFVILFWRFVIPTIVLGGYLIFNGVESFSISVKMLPQIFVIAMVGFTLPLYFLLKGFVKSTIISFSIFNLLIPLATIILAVFLHPKDLENMLNVYSMAGCLLVLAGFSLSENFFNLNKILNRERDEYQKIES